MVVRTRGRSINEEDINKKHNEGDRKAEENNNVAIVEEEENKNKKKAVGNLGSLLIEFEKSIKENTNFSEGGGANLNIDDGNTRHRSLTLGSEFDLGSAMDDSVMGILDAESNGCTGREEIKGKGIMNVVAHTPPTQMGTSYEAMHFGKRMRSGSISGRIRSASFLEEKGVIDRQHKDILKDLIISGDQRVLSALDKYDEGDGRELQELVRSGVLLGQRSEDIDLLDDLDLDFLTVNDLQNQQVVHHEHFPVAPKAPDPMVKVHSYQADDGIGDLDFAFHGSDVQPLAAPQEHPAIALMPAHPIPAGMRSRSASTGSLSEARMRSNTFGSLLEAACLPDQTPSASMFDPKPQYQDISFVQYNQQPPATTPSPTPTPTSPKPSKKIHKTTKQGRPRKNKTQDNTNTPSSPKPRKKYTRHKDTNSTSDQTNQPNKTLPTPSGLGLPRSLSDPNLTTHHDSNGLLEVSRPEGWVGAYSPTSRKIRIERFLAKREHRTWTKTVKYDVRKNFADSRLRVKGRFVKKEDELLMRDLISLT